MKGKFTGYTKSAAVSDIKQWFERKHGYAPLYVLDGKSIWLVGPLRDDEPKPALVHVTEVDEPRQMALL